MRSAPLGFSRLSFGQGTLVGITPTTIYQSAPLVSLQASGQQLQVSAISNQVVRIEGTDSLAETNAWVPLETFQITSSPQAWNVPQAGGAKFFRAVWVP